ncbi:MAG TPA: VOC family protein [Bauldia sp.]|nr:VOC family protein [Bauldia sp.]
MRGIKGIGHVALSVKEIQRSLDFYVGKLGFEEMFRLYHPDDAKRLWIVYLRITDTQFLELFPGGTGETTPKRWTLGFDHLCLECSDIDLAIADLTAKGVPLMEARKVGADDNVQAWIADPDGHRIELMQLGPNSLQLAAIKRLATVRQ